MIINIFFFIFICIIIFFQIFRIKFLSIESWIDQIFKESTYFISTSSEYCPKNLVSLRPFCEIHPAVSTTVPFYYAHFPAPFPTVESARSVLNVKTYANVSFKRPRQASTNQIKKKIRKKKSYRRLPIELPPSPAPTSPIPHRYSSVSPWKKRTTKKHTSISYIHTFFIFHIFSIFQNLFVSELFFTDPNFLFFIFLPSFFSLF